ncbi:metal ABC transporter solute-binding protein, Zn/Mn family [uncultured Dialister sp.]|uniref:metal ABC transporter solute-binding protein, Zn/Mn family n=1 Tax=uncultured Dialister sp. TaxID=278064 RepID=UPI002615B9B0|nr:zinc ABC transporter substrate-binding protein [uncultured Dialister sp.]
MKSHFKKEIALLLAAIAFTAGCGKEPPAVEEGKIPVVVSFGAMEKLTEAIGGDAVSISVMVPDGTEPHDFEPRAGDLVKLKEAKVFVYNGMGMEHWADKALRSAGSDNRVVVKASEKVTPILLEDEEEREEHGDYDPHTWLGLSEAKEEARAIRDGLITASPENRDLFMKNYSTFAAGIDSLQAEYREKLSKAPRKELVTGHAAFGYLARDFSLTQESVEDAFATGEPPARKLVELIRFCRAHQVKTIFTEEMMDPALARTLANEAGADAETLSTLEEPDKESYLDTMRENLEKIEKAMK